MRPAAIGTAVAGIAIVIGLIAAGGHKLDGTSDAGEIAASMPEAEQPAPTAPPPPPVTNPQASMAARPVDDASQFYPAAAEGKPLEREAAPEPEKKPVAVSEKGIDLLRPVAESAGVLGFAERRLQLVGVTPTPVDKTCADAGGKQWPCGVLAKTNFRLFLRLRTVSCDLDSAEWTGTATAACKIGGQDLSQWLIENGWAEAAEGSAFAEAGAKAKEEKSGIYGEDPRKGGAMTIPELPSAEETTDPL
jgi:endonuclease YncB( thermonuclease family)